MEQLQPLMQTRLQQVLPRLGIIQAHRLHQAQQVQETTISMMFYLIAKIGLTGIKSTTL
ncbi:unnamed protein product [Protopolystoma xenopodis]|uniref:Uncharacterized protein n=1 Tax=Protopolystoma xenopodis TaxID=117903 RepID=A0A3S5B1A0_9PLAT|nr:unnamed protein product [Protopolystoma xenopodis]